ncbi:MAG: ABC transporter ATP-binding protein [Lachnospiraceae bacterium]
MLKVKNVSTGYGKQMIVHNVSFEVADNENLCIIGPNGCGKTTLLRAVCNLLPFEGSIEVDGRPVQKMRQNEIAAKIAMMSQSAGVYFSYSVYDTVMMGRYLHFRNGMLKMPQQEDRQIVLQCLETLDLMKVKDQEITTLSGGQLQRVFLARTLVQEPQIILLDEPTNHLDLKYQIELIEYLRVWSQQENHSVIGVLHDINLAMRLSDSIVMMKDGAMAAYGSATEIMTKERLRDTYDIDIAGYMKESLQRWMALN